MISLQDLPKLLQEEQQNMTNTLINWSNINSGTTHLHGLSIMHQTLSEAFSNMADEIKTLPSKPYETVNMNGNAERQVYGDMLLIKKRPELTRRILLAGHMDTVFHKNHPFQTVRFIDDNTINGPGVADMKGGLLIMLKALEYFEQLPVAKEIGFDILINADEETGSHGSSAQIDLMAKEAKAALVYEPAMDKLGTLAKNRKGSGKLTLIAKGKAAHAGRAFFDGKNAIAYLSEALVLIHELNFIQDGITINIGKIAGGEALNVVPDCAVAKLDIRITHQEDEHWVRQKLEEIQNKLKRPDYQLHIEGQFSRPVKRVNSATSRLFERVRALGLDMGIDIQWKDSGGCCDGNNIARHGVPVLDTLGVRGGNIHSSEEFALLDSLPERTLLSTLLLADLASGGLEDLHR